jgi:hypothetical protein
LTTDNNVYFWGHRWDNKSEWNLFNDAASAHNGTDSVSTMIEYNMRRPTFYPNNIKQIFTNQKSFALLDMDNNLFTYGDYKLGVISTDPKFGAIEYFNPVLEFETTLTYALPVIDEIMTYNNTFIVIKNNEAIGAKHIILWGSPNLENMDPEDNIEPDQIFVLQENIIQLF